MATVARAASARGICPADCAARIGAVVQKFGLPDRTAYPLPALCGVMLADKKRRGGAIRVVVPERIGACRLEKMPVEALKDFMKAGL